VGRWFSFLVRCLVMVAIVACGLLLFETYRELFHQVTPRDDQPREPVPDLLGRFQAELIRPGGWSFGETRWALRNRTVPEAEVDAPLAPPVPPGVPPGPRTALEEEALRWFRTAGKKQKTEGGFLVYELPKPELRLRALTRVEGGSERIVLVQVAWSAGPGVWTLLEIRPAGEGGEREGHLLPGPDLTSLARRWDEGGHLVAEIVRPRGELEEWLSSLAKDNWAPRDLVKLPREGLAMILQRKERVVLAWRFPALGGPLDGCLLLVADLMEQRREGRAP
jgi:hypothetical protein